MTIDKELLEKLQGAIKTLHEVEHALEEALKPPKLDVCPFCGARPIYHTTVYDGDGIRRFWVRCYGDGCKIHPETKWYLTKQEAARAWNKRCEENENGERN